MADCESVIDDGIDGKPPIAAIELRLHVVVTVTVTVLFELEAGEDATAETTIPLGTSALTAVAKLVQPEGRVKPAFL